MEVYFDQPTCLNFAPNFWNVNLGLEWKPYDSGLICWNEEQPGYETVDCQPGTVCSPYLKNKEYYNVIIPAWKLLSQGCFVRVSYYSLEKINEKFSNLKQYNNICLDPSADNRAPGRKRAQLTTIVDTARCTFVRRKRLVDMRES